VQRLFTLVVRKLGHPTAEYGLFVELAAAPMWSSVNNCQAID
jgi:hypothetical protein